MVFYKYLFLQSAVKGILVKKYPLQYITLAIWVKKCTLQYTSFAI